MALCAVPLATQAEALRQHMHTLLWPFSLALLTMAVPFCLNRIIELETRGAGAFGRYGVSRLQEFSLNRSPGVGIFVASWSTVLLVVRDYLGFTNNYFKMAGATTAALSRSADRALRTCKLMY